MSQTKFSFAKISLEHGGKIQKGKRKLARPVTTKRPMHLVLRSSKARGHWSFLTLANQKYINRLLDRLSVKYDVKIEEFSNVGNHLHMLVKAKTRKGFQGFLRIFTGLTARKITGAVKGDAKGKFWDSLAYTRVIEWGKALDNVRHYIWMNDLEVLGWEKRKNKRKDVGTKNREGPLSSFHC